MAGESADEAVIPNMSLLDITDGENDRKIPCAKFLDDIQAFSESFSPPASAELLIGAYTELHNKYRTFEATLTRKLQHLKDKVPDLEKSLSLVQALQAKKGKEEATIIRYGLAESIYAKAELINDGTVNLWLGANVMLEYKYDEAIEFLTLNKERARTELDDVKKDLVFVRDQIVTCEVLRSRIFNWDVRRRRALKDNQQPS